MASIQPRIRDRRRSQRAPAVQAVEVAWHKTDGTYTRQEAKTEDVSPHGALLRTKHGLEVREVVVVRRGAASDWSIARVMRCGPHRSEGWTPVGVELAVLSESFWGSRFSSAA